MINGNFACLSMLKKSKYQLGHHTVETLYSTIYYSKYFIELNIAKSTKYGALWTHKRHSTPYLALSGELWSVFYEYFNRNWSCYKGFLLYLLILNVNQIVMILVWKILLWCSCIPVGTGLESGQCWQCDLGSWPVQACSQEWWYCIMFDFAEVPVPSFKS